MANTYNACSDWWTVKELAYNAARYVGDKCPPTFSRVDDKCADAFMVSATNMGDINRQM